MKKLKLYKYKKKPGYSDMRGARYSEVLKKNESGEWIIKSAERPYFSAPTKVSTYAVTEEEVEYFEKYLKDIRIPSLSKRLKSSIFVTDYSPWYYSITFRGEDGSYKDEKDYTIEENRIYSRSDRKK